MGIIDNYDGFKPLGHGDLFAGKNFISIIKKVVLLSLLLLLGTGQVYSATGKIEITQPTSKDTVVQGQVLSIKWTSEGQPSLYVTIQLMDKSGSSVIETIAGNVNNSGWYKWNIPQDIAIGKYSIKVTAQAGYSDRSDVFIIKPNYALIQSVEVNQQGAADSCVDPTKRAQTSITDGIRISVNAYSAIQQPILYKYRVELTNQYTGQAPLIYNGDWVYQSALHLNPTYDEVIETVFPDTTNIPAILTSVAGRVYVWVKHNHQTAPPQAKETCFSLRLN